VISTGWAAALRALAAASTLCAASAAPMSPAVPSGDRAAAIEVCFAPEQDCAGLAVRTIEQARQRILVSAYNLTTGAGIVEALARARARGVDVRLVADRRTPCERNSGIAALAAAGTPIWIDHTVPIAHAKTMVIDDSVTLMGSYNWTRSAARNSEDLNRVTSPLVAAAYAARWQARAAVSVPFAGREGWCRPRPGRAIDGG
jgi:phosphatidylserine/phosphatidylglycerophosphate/cardiolipin synthase-like enzyme